MIGQNQGRAGFFYLNFSCIILYCMQYNIIQYKFEEKMKKKSCENCPLRKKYDASPTSLAGRFWKWHIKFCPGWKSYLHSKTPEEREILFKAYGRRKIREV